MQDEGEGSVRVRQWVRSEHRVRRGRFGTRLTAQESAIVPADLRTRWARAGAPCSSPVNHRAVIDIVGLWIAPVVIDFFSDCIFIQLDPKSWGGRQGNISFLDFKWVLQISLP